jgi:acyl dehydratase
MTAHVKMALAFEDVSVGESWRSQSRTVTETDVVNFACLTGDFNPLHVDQHFARQTPYGRPVAHGLLGLSLVAGLGSHSPLMSTAAFLRIVEWRFLHPLFIGDTVYVQTQVLEKHPKGRRHGMVVWQRQLVKDDNQLVLQQGIYETLVQTELARAAA